MVKKILLIDDSEDIGELVKKSLEGYFIQHVQTLSQAEKELKELSYSLILIDVSLPDGDGFDLCQRLFTDSKYKKIPKVLLTGKIEPANKIYGFTCGADDYITKPFHMLELRARVDRYLTRQTENSVQELAFGDFIFNLAFQKCYFMENSKRQDLGLTPTEFRLFLTLFQQEGQPLSRAFLERSIWQSQGVAIQARGIDTHIAHLRKKLGPMSGLIVSVYGQGYALKNSAESVAA